MAQDRLSSEIWPTVLAEGDHLYAMVNDNENVEYLIFSSVEKKKTYVRDNNAWAAVHGFFFRDVEDIGLFDYEVDTQFIRYYDAVSSAGEVVPYEFDESAITAAAQAAELSSCPPVTFDTLLNLKNRQKAIDSVGYGPLDPNLLNQDFWNTKAEMWSVSIDEARQSRCSSCAMSVINSKMMNCIAAGTEQGGLAPTGSIDSVAAAELGYCQAFDFKCTASRTCDAWVASSSVSAAAAAAIDKIPLVAASKSPCWDGYKQVGMKKGKKGKMVPNCVPVNASTDTRSAAALADASEYGGECPQATQDVQLNLTNRQNAIDNVGYGPLNPAEPNEEFWQDKGDRWNTDPKEAKTALCGNCIFFIRTSKMLKCIESGIGLGTEEAQGSIDAGELGYCSALDFKCASKRTCNAWAVGGPITDSNTQYKGAQ